MNIDIMHGFVNSTRTAYRLVADLICSFSFIVMPQNLRFKSLGLSSYLCCMVMLFMWIDIFDKNGSLFQKSANLAVNEWTQKAFWSFQALMTSVMTRDNIVTW